MSSDFDWLWGVEMAQLVKKQATKPNFLSLLLVTHLVKGESQLIQVDSDLHIYAMAHGHTHAYI